MLIAKKEWFKLKKIGLGVVPIKKEGWIYSSLIIILYILCFVYGSKNNNQILMGVGLAFFVFYIIDMILITIYLNENK